MISAYLFILMIIVWTVISKKNMKRKLALSDVNADRFISTYQVEMMMALRTGLINCPDWELDPPTRNVWFI